MSHSSHKSHLLTQEVAKRAVELVLPAVERLIESKALKRGDFHVVIALRPTYWSGNHTEEDLFKESIIYEYSHTDPKKWDHPYEKIARSKCLISWYTGKSTHEIQTAAPHLLRHGDTAYYGSAVRDEIVVSCSGVQPYFDEMISSWILAVCRALCIQAREALGDGTGGFIHSL